MIDPPKAMGPRRIDHGFSAEQVAEFDRFVAPGYLAPFAQLALEHLEHRPSFTRRLADTSEPARRARVAHLYARTGYYDDAVLRALPGAQLFGTDPSPDAVACASATSESRAARGVLPGDCDYRVVASIPSPFDDGWFSHGVTIHPAGNIGDRARLLAEYRRLLAPGGQIVLAIPLRGSFTELGDLLREYALKHDAPDVEAAVTGATSLRPGAEGLALELSRAGFEQVTVTTKTTSLAFPSGQAMFDDAAMRLLVFPELEQNLGIALTKPLIYAQSAIDKYWSGGDAFELTIVAGCAAGFRRP
ncbi:class I SAM-dependent methyltransferase [Pendulispora albinea]|uniref:Class I SAM-dependent methyltransferase n=1 Tax=Pendulispora albinea TaxID=2741071 RepID=A0ABZ2M9C6_9BACT